jgi:hypothetical protein
MQQLNLEITAASGFVSRVDVTTAMKYQHPELEIVRLV